MQVFHFLSSHWAIDDLKNRHLKISRISDLNDPFELFSAELPPSRKIRKAFYALKKHMSSAYGVICCSKDWKNPLMWSHYADKHRGICLGFSVPDEFFEAVNYSARRLKFKLYRGENGFTVDPKFILKLLKTKFEDWHYENEVRCFPSLNEIDPLTGQYFMSFSHELRLNQVIIGPRCEVPISEITEALTGIEWSVQIIKTRYSSNDFAIVQSPL